jgi:uncharacterized protein YrzB (UPF0473 family)
MSDVVGLVDENGNEQTYVIIDRIQIEENKYVAIIPYYESEDAILNDEGEVVVLKVFIDGNEEYLEPIADDDEFELVSKIFEERLLEG